MYALLIAIFKFLPVSWCVSFSKMNKAYPQICSSRMPLGLNYYKVYCSVSGSIVPGMHMSSKHEREFLPDSCLFQKQTFLSQLMDLIICFASFLRYVYSNGMLQGVTDKVITLPRSKCG